MHTDAIDRKLKVSNRKRKLIRGVGFNDADYVVQPIINGKNKVCPFYSRWIAMLNRCYSLKYQKDKPTYSECSVSDDWLTFSNFRKWMKSQDWAGKDLDKDLLVQGNKLYSEDTCLFIDPKINNLISSGMNIKRKTMVGARLTKSGKYESSCTYNDQYHHIGTFSKEIDAHNAYQEFKIELIKLIASSQPEPIKSALLRYEIPEK
ncbi:DNA-binding domain protein [Vibrio phage 1.210.O._10N.222.52.C2]|nr:DNA-binding domain protein [Vibrio phage 1.210.O._10N.222.52.C2]